MSKMEVDLPEDNGSKRNSSVTIQENSPTPIEMQEVGNEIICMSQSSTSESLSSGANANNTLSSSNSPDSHVTESTSSSHLSQNHKASNSNGEVTSSRTLRAKRKLTEDESTTRTRYEELVDTIEKAKERLMEEVVSEAVILSNLEEGKKVVDELMEMKSPVAVDCEGVNLGDRRTGKVTLVQVGDMQGTVYLFDVQEEPKLAEELKKLLESEEIIKVMHDCRSDSEGLNHQFQIKLKNVFDTQVAHTVIRKGTKEYQKSDKNAGLDTVCKMHGGYPSPFKDNIKGVYRTDQAFWTNRPLNDIMISYAASDVLCLVPTVYMKLNSLIVTEEDKKSFFEACNAQINQLQEKHNKKGENSRHRNNRGGCSINHNRGRGYQRGPHHNHSGGCPIPEGGSVDNDNSNGFNRGYNGRGRGHRDRGYNYSQPSFRRPYRGGGGRGGERGTGNEGYY